MLICFFFKSLSLGEFLWRHFETLSWHDISVSSLRGLNFLYLLSNRRPTFTLWILVRCIKRTFEFSLYVKRSRWTSIIFYCATSWVSSLWDFILHLDSRDVQKFRGTARVLSEALIELSKCYLLLRDISRINPD